MAEQKKSGDGCAWSTPRVIYANTTPGETVTIGGVTGVADSTIVVALVRYATPSPTQARDFRSFAVTSHDAGQTWGAPTPMTSGFGGQAYASSLAPAPGSGVLAALYGTDAPGEYAGWYVRLARSTDQGATWQPWGEALRDPEHPFTEPQLLATPDRLLVALRHDSNESGAFLAESSDAGEHFSTPRRITSGTSGMPTLGRAADGRYLMAYREGAAFRYATSRDLVTWSLGFDVTGGSGRRMLYAGFAQLTRGRTVVVYALENPEGDPNTWAGVYSALIPAP
jgi:hypothetical protein